MNYLIIFKTDAEYLDLKHFDKLKTNQKYEYTFDSNYLLVKDKLESKNMLTNPYLINQLRSFESSKVKTHILNQTIKILNTIVNTINNTYSISLETQKNKLKLNLSEFIEHINTNNLIEELNVNEEEIGRLRQHINNGKNHSKYQQLQVFVNDKIKKIREMIQNIQYKITPNVEDFELNNNQLLKVKSIFDDLNISNESKYFTSQYFQTIDEEITGYYNIINYNKDKHIILQTHFFDEILENDEYADLFYEYIYLLYKPKLQKLFQKLSSDNIAQEESIINKQLKKEYLNLRNRLSVSQEDWMKNRIQEYYEEKESKMKNDIIQYLKQQYEYNTKILQQINKSKSDYNNILSPKNTTIWYIHLNFDIEKTYNINSIDKIQKPLKLLDTKDTTEENCNRSKKYFQMSWVDSIDSNLYTLVHDDPKKLKTHFQNFKTFISNLF